jgi:hypothetical protein
MKTKQLQKETLTYAFFCFGYFLTCFWGLLKWTVIAVFLFPSVLWKSQFRVFGELKYHYAVWCDGEEEKTHVSGELNSNLVFVNDLLVTLGKFNFTFTELDHSNSLLFLLCVYLWNSAITITVKHKCLKWKKWIILLIPPGL